MSEHEDLRAALIELDKLRLRERAASHENATLLRVLDAMTSASSGEEAASRLVDICAEALKADAVALVAINGVNGLSVIVSSTEDLRGVKWEGGADLLHRPRRMVNLHKGGSSASIKKALRRYKALLAMPVPVEGERAMALLATARAEAHFSGADLHLLGRIAFFAGQALASQRLARRNTMLAALIDGSAQAALSPQTFLDTSLQAVSSAFDRLTQAQGAVVAINNDLLRAKTDQIDAAIHAALARTGALARADRVYVFRLVAEDRMDNTHEWVSDGIEPMIAHLQDMPVDLMAPWVPSFRQDQEVYIPDVTALPDDDPIKDVLADQGIRSLLAVPMLRDGEITGFLGYDAVRENRNFLPGEIFLLRSVGNTINAMLERSRADQRAEAATHALLSERNRVQATLDAMPDLVLELDSKGIFTGYHVSHNVQLEAIAQAMIGKGPDAALPREAADVVWRIMCEVDAKGRTDRHEFGYDLPDGRRWLQISAAARQGGAADSGYVFVIRDITDARAQRHEIERLSEVARRTTNLVIVSDPQGRVQWVNAAFEQRSGWSLAEIQGQTPGSFLQSDKSDKRTIRRIGAALRKRTPVSAQILNVSRLGEEYWVSLDIQPLWDAKGRHQGFMAVQSDITERRMQAEQLQATTALAIKARQRLVSAVEALQDGFAIYDADGCLLLCNQPYRDFFPRSGPLIREGMTYLEILNLRLAHREYRAAIGREEEWLAQRLDHHRNPFSEIEQELSDGRWVRSFEKATPDGGRVALRVDITALKEAERRALNERAAAMDASQDGIALTDAQGYFIYMNPAHRVMFGISAQEDVRKLSWESLYEPREVDLLRAAVLPVLQRQRSWQGELSGRHRDGTKIEQEVSLSVQDDGGIVCITRDIAERRRSEAERARLREELQLAQRREVIGQLAAGLAHDFNNILAVISGSAALIETRLMGQGADTQDASRIVQAANRAAGLVTRLRDVGKHASERQQLDLRKCLAEAADLLRTGLSNMHKLAVLAPDTPQLSIADPTDILQVLLNLGINARDALDDSPNEIAMSVAAADLSMMDRPPDIGVLHDDSAYIMLRVQDTGPGIDPQTRARIFEPYFTSKGQQGTGLGLAIVAGIVRGNDAALWFDTTSGIGTRVTVFWPVNGPQARHKEDAAQVGDMIRLDGVQALIVDDEEEICAVLSATLEAAGAEVASATDPRDALDAISGDPDYWTVLITDHDMPHMTGSQLAQAARKVAPHLPVLLVSALPDAAGDHRGLFDAVLQKPVDPRLLVRMIAKAVVSKDN